MSSLVELSCGFTVRAGRAVRLFWQEVCSGRLRFSWPGLQVHSIFGFFVCLPAFEFRPLGSLIAGAWSGSTPKIVTLAPFAFKMGAVLTKEKIHIATFRRYSTQGFSDERF